MLENLEAIEGVIGHIRMSNVCLLFGVDRRKIWGVMHTFNCNPRTVQFLGCCCPLSSVIWINAIPSLPTNQT